MSTTNTAAEAVEDAHQELEEGDVEAAIDTLSEEVRRLAQENEHLQDRVDDLQDDLDESARIRWSSEDLNDAMLESSTGMELPFGRILNSRAGREVVSELKDRVSALEEGEVDVIIRGECDGNELPIERKIAERKAGGDLSSNKARATLIFPKFAGYAETRGGSQLVLSSSDVRNILQETTDRSDWPNETVKRAMEWTAKLTSPREDKADWDAYDDENLLTLQQGRGGNLELAADAEEYHEFYEEIAKSVEGSA